MSFQVGFPTTPSPPEGPPDHSRPYGRVSRPLPVLQEGLTSFQ